MKSDNINDEKMDEISLKVMKLVRDKLVMSLRFLDPAINRLELKSCNKSFGTNGKVLFYNPSEVLSTYKKNKTLVLREYLHCIMHSILRHMYSVSNFEPELWGIATDIAVEAIIIDLKIKSFELEEDRSASEHIEYLKKQLGVLTAEKIYYFLLDLDPEDKKRETYKKIFTNDDHDLWDKDDDGNDPDEMQGAARQRYQLLKMERDNDWKEVANSVQVDLQTFNEKFGRSAGSLVQNLAEVNRENYDYTQFLKEFSVMGEVMKVNPDEFDYVFYSYGLELYDNMPLVEPLEYKETKRVKDFVIAIDTSGSVRGELVQSFINKTYNILKSEDSFFSSVNIHIIQCDADIQSHVKITKQSEFDEYIKNMKLTGFGGTDFRPVFELVDKLIEDKEFDNLKGLIYFTDGYGTFPVKMPSYKAAFVFVDDDMNDVDVPVWAIKLVLRRRDLKD